MRYSLNKPLFRSAVWLLALQVVLATGCNVSKLLKPVLDDVEARSGTIARNIVSGATDGIDTTKLNALVRGLTAELGRSLQKELDAVSFKQVEDSLETAILGVLNEGIRSIEDFLQDSTTFDQLTKELDAIVYRVGYQIDSIAVNLIPGLLNSEAQLRIYELRDSLLGPATADGIGRLLVGSLEDLRESGELDSLISRIDGMVLKTKTQVDDTVMSINKTLARVLIGAGISLLGLALLFFMLWWRKRTKARQQTELLVNMTKAIDAIPTRDDYDRTVAYLQEQLNGAPSAAGQHAVLKEILEDHSGEYTEKQKYRDYYRRLIQEIKLVDQDGALKEQLMNGHDEGFRQFLERELAD